MRLPLPVDRQLDRLVDHGAASGARCPFERGVRGEMQTLATVDAGQRVLRDIQPTPPQRVEAVAERGLESGRQIAGEASRCRRDLDVATAEELDDSALRRV